MFNPRKKRSRSLFRERRRNLGRRKLTVEAIEERFLLSNVFQVTLPTDDGTGAAVHSLSWAIRQVDFDGTDTKASPDQIDFSIGPGGPQTIMVTGGLPDIIRPVIIDGTSQPGVIPVGTEPILIDGSGVTTGGESGLSLYYGSDGSTVKGLAISNFNDNGIWLYSGSNTITGDDIGTNQSGTSAFRTSRMASSSGRRTTRSAAPPPGPATCFPATRFLPNMGSTRPMAWGLRARVRRATSS